MFNKLNMSEISILKFIHRFNILRDKINFGIELNKLDENLIHILEEYDFLIEYIDEEQKKG